MTGIVTAAMIDLMSSGSDMRATPPSLRMSAGTRSSAITAHAPASWAMRACSAVTTSMITPPLSIWARPDLTLKVPLAAGCPLPPFRCATVEILRGGYGESRVPALALVAGVELSPVPALARGLEPLQHLLTSPPGGEAGRGVEES